MRHRHFWAGLLASVLVSYVLTPAVATAESGMRRVYVYSNPQGSRIEPAPDSSFRLRTPTYFDISAEEQELTLHRIGHERARVNIPAGSRNLRINVEMSRPVFEAGLALTIIGGLVFSIALPFAIVDGFSFGYGVEGGVIAGGLVLIPGIIMMARDRRRRPTSTILELPDTPQDDTGPADDERSPPTSELSGDAAGEVDVAEPPPDAPLDGSEKKEEPRTGDAVDSGDDPNDQTDDTPSEEPLPDEPQPAREGESRAGSEEEAIIAAAAAHERRRVAVRPRFFLRGTLEYMFSPAIHSIIPKVGLGIHFARDGYDFRVIAELGPTVSLASVQDVGRNIMIHTYVVPSFIFYLGDAGFALLTELGLGFGLCHAEEYREDGRYVRTFLSFGFLGVGLGFSNRNLSVTVGLRGHFGFGERDFYLDDDYNSMTETNIAFSTLVQVEYAW